MENRFNKELLLSGIKNSLSVSFFCHKDFSSAQYENENIIKNRLKININEEYSCPLYLSLEIFMMQII